MLTAGADVCVYHEYRNFLGMFSFLGDRDEMRQHGKEISQLHQRNRRRETLPGFTYRGIELMENASLDCNLNDIKDFKLPPQLEPARASNPLISTPSLHKILQEIQIALCLIVFAAFPEI